MDDGRKYIIPDNLKKDMLPEILENVEKSIKSIPIPKNGKDGRKGKDGKTIVGPIGPVGPKGDKGDKGDIGPIGLSGKDGRDGIDGKNATFDEKLVDKKINKALSKLEVIAPNTPWGSIPGDINNQKDLVDYVSSHGGGGAVSSVDGRTGVVTLGDLYQPVGDYVLTENVHNVPAGGTENQVLAKNSNTDYDLKWANGGSGTSDHSLLSNLDYDHAGHTGFASKSYVDQIGFINTIFYLADDEDEGATENYALRIPPNTLATSSDDPVILNASMGEQFVDPDFLGYISPINDPAITKIQAGYWKFAFWGKTSDITANSHFVAHAQVIHEDNTITELFNCALPNIDSEDYKKYICAEYQPAFDILATDRMCFNIGVITDSPTNITVTFSHGSISTMSYVQCPFLSLKSPIIDILYTDLKTLADDSQLTPQQLYRITDFRTRTFVQYDESYNYVYTEGDIEPIIVQAISPDGLSYNAFSEAYPADIIHYSITDTYNFFEGDKGRITYRSDTRINVTTQNDFRGVRYRRWNDGNGEYCKMFDGVSYVFGTPPDLADYIDYPMFERVDVVYRYWKNVFIGNASGGNGLTNMVFRGGGNDVIIQTGESNHFGNGCSLIKAETAFAYNCFYKKSNVSNITVGSVFQYNQIKGNFADSIIGGACSGNLINMVVDDTIWLSFQSNTIGYSFQGNTINVNLTGCTIDNYCLYNNLSYLNSYSDTGFQESHFGINFQGNTFRMAVCSSCDFVRDWSSNTIYVSQFLGNTFLGATFSNQIQGDNFVDTTVGDSFHNNQLVNTSISASKIGAYFGSWYMENAIFDAVTTDYGCNTNTVTNTTISNSNLGNNWSTNVVDISTFMLCTFLSDFTSNIITKVTLQGCGFDRSCYENTFSGNDTNPLGLSYTNFGYQYAHNTYTAGTGLVSSIDTTSFGKNCVWNYFENVLLGQMVFGDTFNNNSFIGVDSSPMSVSNGKFGNGCGYNIIRMGSTYAMQYNEIADSFANNVLYLLKFENNSIKSFFENNILGDGENYISWFNNTIGKNASYDIWNGTFDGNTYDDGLSQCVFGASVEHITCGTGCSYVEFGNSISNLTIGKFFYYGTIGDGCASLRIGDGVQAFTIGTNVTSVTVDDYYLSLTIPAYTSALHYVKQKSLSSQDIEITDASMGLILKNSNGDRYRLGVDNSGNLTVTLI